MTLDDIRERAVVSSRRRMLALPAAVVVLTPLLTLVDGRSVQAATTATLVAAATVIALVVALGATVRRRPGAADPRLPLVFGLPRTDRLAVGRAIRSATPPADPVVRAIADGEASRVVRGYAWAAGVCLVALVLALGLFALAERPGARLAAALLAVLTLLGAAWSLWYRSRARAYLAARG
ncbi:MAG: hypothetical protein ACTHMS_17005 [Jatrophihabitans sp.]|uniref:hypothetical protein n=1 Tax=Jatrophihabitans sp. TaxID=1932789 RepID=UPI003F7E2358